MTKETEAAGPLTLDGILDAATAIIEGHGVAGLTMRRLAAACDSTPMTLYRHVRDKSELERAVADRFLGGVPLPRVAGRF